MFLKSIISQRLPDFCTETDRGFTIYGWLAHNFMQHASKSSEIENETKFVWLCAEALLITLLSLGPKIGVGGGVS